MADYSNLSGVANDAATITDSFNRTRNNGSRSIGGSATSGAIRGAGLGLALAPATLGLSVAIGAGVGALAGGISQSINNNKIKESEKRQRDLESKRFAEQLVANSKSVLSSYPSFGSDSFSLYAEKGGIIPKFTLGSGGLMQYSNTVGKFVGAKHSQGGIQVGQSEVEGGEVVFNDQYGNNKVLSKKDGFADVALQYQNTDEYKYKIQEFEKNLAKTNSKKELVHNRFSKGTVEQELGNLEHPLEVIFKQQEDMKKQQQPNNKLASGGYLEPFPKIKYNNKSIEKPLPYNTGFSANKRLNTPLYSTENNEINYIEPSPSKFYNNGRPNYPTIKNNNILDANSNELKSDNIISTPIINNRLNNNYDINGKSNYSAGFEQTKTQQDLKKKNNNKINYSDIASNVLPLVDNVVNSIITSKTPQIPVPQNLQAAQLKTNINVNPQLRANRDNYLSGLKNLSGNISNPGVIAGNQGAMFSNMIRTQSDIYGNKENTETQLINNNRLNNQTIGNQNIAQNNQYAYNKMLRTDDIQNRQSANVANAIEDSLLSIQQKNLQTLDKQKFDLVMAKYKTTGVLDRVDLEWLDEMMKRPTTNKK